MEQGKAKNSGEDGIDLVENVVSLTQSLRNEAVARVTLFLAMLIVVNVFLTLLSLSTLAYAVTENGASLYLSGLILCLFYVLAFVVLYFYLTRKVTGPQIQEMKESQAAIQENIIEIKEKTLESINPMSFIKSNSVAVVLGTFVLGLSSALLSDRKVGVSYEASRR